MHLRLLNHFAVFAVFVGCQATSLHAQEAQQHAYKPAIPFASLSRQASASSSLGRVDDGVDQSIGGGSFGQIDASASGSMGLDQMRSPGAGGQRSAHSSLSSANGAGTQRLIKFQTNQAPPGATGMRSSGQTSSAASLLSPNKQSTSMGGNSNAPSVRVISGQRPSQVDAMKRFAKSKRMSARAGSDDYQVKGVKDATLPTFDSDQKPFERLGDPFLAPSTASFEGFTKSFGFEPSCGDACSLRATTAGERSAGESFDGESKRRRRRGELPDDQSPAPKRGYGQGSILSVDPSATSPMKPY